MAVILLWGGYTVDYPATGFSFYKVNGFDRIRAPKFSLRGEPGTPELPAVYLNYIIPPNAKAESVIVSQFQYVQIPGEYLIYPAQPPRVIGESVPWVPPDTIVYNSDNLFPGEFIKVVGEGIMDGARIVTVEICPLQYRPRTKRLFIVSPISFDFVFVPNTLPELRPHIRGKHEQLIYDRALAKVVVNDYEIPTYYQKPTLVDEATLMASSFAPGVIITPDWFKPYFLPYANWLIDQGLPTVIISPDWIYQNFSGCDNAEKIRNYFKYCYMEWGGTYFILGGDADFLPVRYATSKNYNPGEFIPVSDSIPCDMYYSDLTGNWDVDGDYVWGEISQDQADRFPEVFVGRIPAYCINEVTNWVSKTLNYEITPCFQRDSLITALWIYNDSVGKGFAYNEFPQYFHHRDCNDQYASVTINKLNAGYGLVTIDCHGDVILFASKWPQPRSYIYSYLQTPNGHAGLNELINQDKYFVCYSISCWNGAYDTLAHGSLLISDTCIADGFVDTYADKGACAYLGNTRDGQLYYPDVGPSHALQHNFYDVLFTQNNSPINDNALSRLGVAEALSKSLLPDTNWLHMWRYRYVCYSHNLFGSPYTEVWTNSQRNFIVFHPIQIPVGQQTRFRVRVRDATTNGPVSYAKVCLNKPGDIYLIDYTDATGWVTFIITPQTSGTLKITVTRSHNLDYDYTQYLPSQTTCQVGWPGGGEQTSDSEEITPMSLSITELPTITKGNVTIKYEAPNQDDITISIYNSIGSCVWKCTQRLPSAGYYRQRVNVKDMTSGVYFIVLTQGKEKVSKKIVLTK